MNLYDFEIIYKSGTSNGNADGLSRMPDPLVELEGEHNYDDEMEDVVICSAETQLASSNINNSTLMQDGDEDLKWIKDMIVENNNDRPTLQHFPNMMCRKLYSGYENLVIKNNVLYKRCETTGRDLYCLPNNMINETLNLAHASRFGGHLGMKKTLERVTSRSYRPGIAQLIIDFVKQCDTCQKVKYTQPIRKGELIYLKPERPNQLVTMDIAGPLPKTPRGAKYILVVICAFTKYSRAFHMDTTTADKIADIIVDEWICMFGVPESILTDRGTNFQSMLLELIYDRLDIKQLRTTAYHPAADGQSERFVRTIKQMLKCYSNKNQNDWDENINKLCFAYNCSVHASTQCTPYEMMFGSKPRIPLDIVLEEDAQVLDTVNSEEFKNWKYVILDEQEEELNPKMSQEAIVFCENKIKKMKSVFEAARENRNSIMDAAKLRHDRLIKKFEYDIGDLVLTDHVNLKKAYAPVWRINITVHSK